MGKHFANLLIFKITIELSLASGQAMTSEHQPVSGTKWHWSDHTTSMVKRRVFVRAVLNAYLQCVECLCLGDHRAHSLETDAEEVHERPDEQVVLRTVPVVHKAERDERGEELTQDPVTRPTQREIDIPETKARNL